MSAHRMDTNIAEQLLPREAYASLDWFEREQRELFGRSWVFAGLVSDLAEPGDYLVPVTKLHFLGEKNLEHLGNSQSNSVQDEIQTA